MECRGATEYETLTKSWIAKSFFGRLCGSSQRAGFIIKKGGVDTVSVVAFAYDIYCKPQKQRGAVRNAYPA
jgi:hypothetical protein